MWISTVRANTYRIDIIGIVLPEGIPRQLQDGADA
jgi:hypothetical protein